MGRRLEWSAEGWFGGLIGLTAWMLVAAVVVGVRSPVAAVGPAVGFVVTGGTGLALWRGRGGMPAGRAVLVLVAVGGVCGLGAMMWMDASGQLGSLWVLTPGGARSDWAAYAALGVYPLLWVVFWWRERAAGGARA